MNMTWKLCALWLYRIFLNELFVSKISGLCHGVEKVVTPLGSYTLCVDCCVPVFQDSLSVPPSMVRQTNVNCINTQKSEDLKLFAWFWYSKIYVITSVMYWCLLSRPCWQLWQVSMLKYMKEQFFWQCVLATTFIWPVRTSSIRQQPVPR